MKIFHAHIYFDVNQLAQAEKVRALIIEDIPQLTYRGPLIPLAVGPHPKPMFELHIPEAIINYAIASIDSMRGNLSVLIHPVIQDELVAHTEQAQWLGTRLTLNLDALG